MKKVSAVAVVAVLAVLAVIYVTSPESFSFDRDGRPGPPRDQLLELFDTDNDNTISAAEMDNATEVLNSRDRDGDGSLTRDELRPPRRGNRGPRDRRSTPERPEIEMADEAASTAPDGLQGIAAAMSKNSGAVVTFRGGHETIDVDSGRPVGLIAAALGVEPEVFRKAFSGVRPASGFGPTPMRAHANKQVLMDALEPYGITNDRLDEVSNYYRYRPGGGELWTNIPATATAVVENGEVVALKITNPGSGYLTAPIATVQGHPNVKVKATVQFGKDLRTNGRISSLTVVK